MAVFIDRLVSEIAAAKTKGTYKESLFLISPMASRVKMEGKGEVLVLSSNNYLGLSNHPDVVNAGIDGLRRFGAGTASVRFICGSFSIHRELEREIADFLKKEAALSYVSCWNANTGLLPTIVTEKDALISDELNHASIIDACRMTGTKVTKKVYKHSDMTMLKSMLEETQSFENRFVVTDGVFSMEGDLAKLPEIVELANKFNAIIVMDDSHATGVIGKTGAGTAEHFGLEKEVDIITSTLGKALGGAAGGFVAGPSALIDHLFQKSRPMLFSNALPPTVASSALAAIKVLRREPKKIKAIQDNAEYFRAKLREDGYKILDGESAIIPIMLGETSRAIAASKKLLAEGIFVTGFGFPVVPEGAARIRIQMSASFTRKDLDFALDVFSKLKSELQ
jgi:glycine C-acetyltransferase